MSDELEGEGRIVSDVGPFAVVPEWVLLDRALNPRALQLYAFLSLRADRRDGSSRWSRERMAEQLGCSEDTVDRALGALMAAGAVSVRKQTRGRSGQFDHNVYTVHRAPCRTFAEPQKRGNAVPPIRTNAALTRERKNQEEEEARRAVATIDEELSATLDLSKLVVVAAAVRENASGVRECLRRARLKGRDGNGIPLFVHMLAQNDHVKASTTASAAARAGDYSHYDLGGEVPA